MPSGCARAFIGTAAASCYFVEGGCGARTKGCDSLGTRHGPFPLIVANGSQWKGGKGRTYCAGGLSGSLLSRLSSR